MSEWQKICSGWRKFWDFMFKPIGEEEVPGAQENRSIKTLQPPCFVDACGKVHQVSVGNKLCINHFGEVAPLSELVGTEKTALQDQVDELAFYTKLVQEKEHLKAHLYLHNSDYNEWRDLLRRKAHCEERLRLDRFFVRLELLQQQIDGLDGDVAFLAGSVAYDKREPRPRYHAEAVYVDNAIKEVLQREP